MHRSRATLPLIFAITLTGILSNAVLAPAIPDVLDAFDRPDSDTGILVAIGSMPGVIVAPIIGFAADRLGRKRVLVPCLVVFGIGGIAAASAWSFASLLWARLAMGFGAAGLINVAVVMIGDNWRGSDRTTILGRNSAVLTVGLATMPLVSGLLTSLISWRAALATYAIGLATAGVIAVRLENYRPDHPGDLRSQVRGAGRILASPIMVAAMLSGFVTFVLIFGVFLATLPVHLEDEFGLSAGWRGVMISLPAISATLVSFNLTRLRERLGIKTMLSAGAAVFAVCFTVIGAAGTVAVIAPASVLYGFGEGGLIPSLQDTAVSVAPDEFRGGVVAGFTGATRLGQTVGPLLAAPLIHAYGTSETMLVGGGLAALFAIGLVLSPLTDARLMASRHD